MGGTKDFDSKDGRTNVLDIPPIDGIDVRTGGRDDKNPFNEWRKKFKNYATYLTYKQLEGKN
jgi:hypothetical protein